jgi:hypothetical protein
MLTKFFWAFTILTLLFACNSADDKTTDSPSENIAKKDSAVVKELPIQPQDKPDTGQYCYIKKIYTTGNTSFIVADYIQFLMGKEAVDAAKKNNNAEMVIDNKGDTVYSVPDNYYILNENTALKTLPLAKNVEILFVENNGTKTDIHKPVFEMLKERIKNDDAIFILTISDGVVKKIKEQYVP